jgi:hypothetical protein
VLNPARPDISVRYNPFHCSEEDYMAVVHMVFGSFNLHDEFFAKHQLNYLADIVRVLVYTGARFNFYDVLVMALDAEVLKEQVEKARRVISSDSSITTQRRLNFEMSVKNLYKSLDDRERVPKIQGLLNECMTFLDDELSIITGPYEDSLSIDDVIDQDLILFVSLNVNKNTEPVGAFGCNSRQARLGNARPDLQRHPRRVRSLRLPELRPHLEHRARHEHRLPLLDAEHPAIAQGGPGIQGGRDLRPQHHHRLQDPE